MKIQTHPLTIFCSWLLIDSVTVADRCVGSSKKLEYLWGDALTDNKGCTGPDGDPYPHRAIDDLIRRNKLGLTSSRQGRNLFGKSDSVQDPFTTRDELLFAHQLARNGQINSIHSLVRSKREASAANITAPAGCVVGGAPPRLCRSSYNTTAPMYGVSLTSGQPVTIVQKFPDLLQQVIYETCESKECDILHGECIQTYVPYLFLVIPLGPVTLTGQDYVLVESGCTCRPKYATPGSDPNPSDVIPNFGNGPPKDNTH